MRQTLMALCIVCLTSVTTLGEETPRRSINTAGEATVYVVPDEAEISLGVETWANKLNDAKSTNDKSAESAVAAIKALGIDAKQISTNDVTVSIDYEGSSYHRQIVGYSVRRTYVVKVKDVSLVSKVVDSALNNGANEISGVTFSSTELRKYRDQARKMAAKAAREKAIDLAAQLDAAVGPVRTVNESSGMWGNYWGGYNRFSGYGQNNMVQNATAAGGDGGDGGDGTAPPGQIAIRASVTTTFDLQDAPPHAEEKPVAK